MTLKELGPLSPYINEDEMARHVSELLALAEVKDPHDGCAVAKATDRIYAERFSSKHLPTKWPEVDRIAGNWEVTKIRFEIDGWTTLAHVRLRIPEPTIAEGKEPSES